MFLVLFVLNNPELIEDVLDAWESVGVSGVTILHSSGLGRVRQNMLRDDLPLIPSLEALLDHDEDFSRTLFSVVKEEAEVDRLVVATQAITGDLSQPDSGLIVVLPILRAYGLDKKSI